jgi:hypothetical protein
MHNRKTLITAQFLISAMMAFLMSGYATAMHLGIGPDFLKIWGRAFITAWPMAFVLSLLVGPLAFGIAARLTLPRS